MNTEKMREEFEAWQCNADDGPQTDPMWMHRVEGGNGAYGINEVQRDWVTWQASRAAIVIQTPEESWADGGYNDDGDIGWFQIESSDWISAIESAGITVKP